MIPDKGHPYTGKRSGESCGTALAAGTRNRATIPLRRKRQVVEPREPDRLRLREPLAELGRVGPVSFVARFDLPSACPPASQTLNRNSITSPSRTR